MTEIHADYLVVGAGACGMAFVDALIDHADVRVVLVDRRHAAGGHWLDAYPFVRLHQASALYGVASTLLGNGTLQTRGPEKGLHERALGAEVVAYYARVLERLLASGQVRFHPACNHLGGHQFASMLSGRRYQVSESARVVDARYAEPDIPSRTPPPFQVAEGVQVVPVNGLAHLTEAPSRYVVVGSGKTATDACTWLLGNGVEPDAICWVRPRDAWMLNRARVQPDPTVMTGMAADTMQAAIDASSIEDLFLRLEDAGVMLRIDRNVMPTMAKLPTIAQWEIDQLATIEDVVRLGYLRRVEPGRLVLSHGEVGVAADAVVVHCAASALTYPPLVPIWGRDAITLQTVRAAFPCFSAAAIGYVEATRANDDEKNRICFPSPMSNSLASWARMQVLGNRAARALSAEPDIKAWSQGTAINPSRVPPDRVDDPAVQAAAERYRAVVRPGLARLAELAGPG
ncbi:MAG: NAD(P)-binding protein [Brooklawnia sp.]|uniref:NAD(P)-binding protein n=1 Tax=Brooklawnia sp. TaxID=2699740 RepID=UPI003C792743